jgi:hypothetical protein
VITFYNDHDVVVHVTYRDDPRVSASLAPLESKSFWTTWRDHWAFRLPVDAAHPEGRVLRRVIVQNTQHDKLQVYSASGVRYVEGSLATDPSWTNIWPRRPLKHPMRERSSDVVSSGGEAMRATVLHSRDATVLRVDHIASPEAIAAVLKECPDGKAEATTGCDVHTELNPLYKALLTKACDVFQMSSRACLQQCQLQNVRSYANGTFEPFKRSWETPLGANNAGIRKGSNRFASMMVAYETAEEGGEILFPHIQPDLADLALESEATGKNIRKGVRVQPGDAVAWYNMYADGNLNQYATWSTTPATKGRQTYGKIVCWDYVPEDTTDYEIAHNGYAFALPFVTATLTVQTAGA